MVFGSRIPLVILVVYFASLFLWINHTKELTLKKIRGTPPPSPTTVEVLGKSKVKYPEDVTILLVGDSMTQSLGNSDELRLYLKDYFPGKSFEVLNYGYGSTNILTLPKRLSEKTYYGREFRPITDILFDIIIIESFGHNPLSDLPLNMGLNKQTEVLKQSLEIIKRENPKAEIVFLATIAPSRSSYAKKTVELSPEKRKIWVDERISYIQNHIKFAKDQNIPIINVFEKSLKSNGDLNLSYVRKDDYIHPSPSGIILISRQIADFLFKQKIIE